MPLLIAINIDGAAGQSMGPSPHEVPFLGYMGEAPHWSRGRAEIDSRPMKINGLLIYGLMIGLVSCLAAQAQEQTNQFIMNWNATGYTINAAGHIMATNLTQQTLINKVAYDNGINPKDCDFVYRVEKRDTAVVWKTNGVFVADVYQMEYTFTDVTNETGSVNYCESLLNDEYHTNAIGTTFGLEEKTFNKDGYLVGYTYHGSFHCAFPEDNVVFTGSFSTGARVYLKQPDD
jgi:hypothetical protein